MDTRYKIVNTLLNEVTTTQTSQVFPIPAEDRTIQASISGTGAVSATVLWYGSNINSAKGGRLFATSTLSGTTTDDTGVVVTEQWPFVYVQLSAISGTDAAVTVTIGY
jgi:hypothetical protein